MYPASGSQPAQARRHYLDVLRGSAALLVVVSHSDQAGLLSFGLDSIQKGFIGTLGVYLFFILSGFLIWTSARDIHAIGGLRTYAVHRVTRLVPLYLVNLAFVVWALPHLASAFTPTVTPEIMLRHLTFTQNLLPDVSRKLNPVLWTLTHEAIFYALVPLLMLLPRLAIPALGLVAMLAGFRFPTAVGPFLALFFLFTVGILLAEGRWRAALAALVVFTATWAVPFHQPLWRVALIPSAGLLILMALCLPNRLLWLTAPLRWAGIISFSLYIWHYLLINLIGTQSFLRTMAYYTRDASVQNDFVRGGTFLALVFLVCTASYWLIERPSMVQLRRLILRGLVPASPSSRTA